MLSERGPLVRAMFDRLSPCYDLVNGVLSFGQHRRWRRVAAQLLRPQGSGVLDVATGTGDLAIELVRAGARRVVALDFSAPMLARARRKLRLAGVDGSVRLVHGDALALPFEESSFEGVASAFLLRNLADLQAGLQEMRRVLRPGGQVVALEITHPGAGPKAAMAGWYFRCGVPWLGGLVSGQWSAYQYLAASVRPFPDVEALASLFLEVGFQGVRYRRLALGLVGIHVARAPDTSAEC